MSTTGTPRPPSDSASVADASGAERAAGVAAATVALSQPVGERASSEEPAEGSLKYLGDYELLGEIARGGMGIVYKARHRKLDRVVALKLTRAGQMLAPDEAQRFYLEAQAVAKLDHPHIVPIYEVGESEGRHFFAMALVEGQSLAQRVAQKPLPSREAALLVRQVALAMAYAHERGVIHRDLKPGNILVDASDQPRVTDFGLAKRVDADSSLTQAGQVMGTPSYMPPEQAEGKVEEVGPLSDVYSLGATLYCLLTGRPPFQSASVVETLKHVVEREAVPVRQLNPGVERDLETICLKCLEKAPARRYASATALADDLQRYLEDRPILARRVGEVEKLLRWCRRNRLVASTLAALIVVFLAAFVLVSLSYWRAEELRRSAVRARDNEQREREAAEAARHDAEQKERAERWERYRANVSAAAGALQLFNIDSARHSLELAPEQHRNWEWQYLYSKLDQARAVTSADDDVLWLIPSRCYRFAYRFGPKVDKVRLINPVSGNQVGTLPARGTTSFVPSPSGSHIVCADDDGTVQLWDVKASRVTASWPHAKGQADVRFSADGKRVIVRAEDHTGQLIDVAEHREIATFAKMHASGSRVTFSADSRRVALLFEDSSLDVLDAATGKSVRAIAMEHGEDAFVISLSPDGSHVATGSFSPGHEAVRLREVATGKEIATAQGHFNATTSIDYSPDGKLIATGSNDQTMRVWDGSTLQPISVIRGHTGPVRLVMFTPDSKHLLSWGDDSSLRLWDPVTGEPLAALLGHRGLPVHLQCSQDGAYVISRDNQFTYRFWDLAHLERQVLRGHTSYVYDVAMSSDGTRAASAAWDGTVRLWDLATGTPAGVLEHEFATDEKVIGGVAFSPDGKLLASVPRNDTVCIWDVATGKRRHALKAATGSWLGDPHLAFNRQGTLLAQGGGNGVVHLWDPESGKPAGEFASRGSAVNDVAFSPDGTVLASVDEKTLRIGDIATHEFTAVLTGHAEVIERVAFSNDGKFIATASHDKTARIWDAKSHQQLAVLNHGSALYGIAFSPDNTRLATACGDNTIRLWDLATYQEVAELRGHGAYVHAVAFSPDGTRLVSASGDFTVRVWDTLSPRQRAEKTDERRDR